MDCLGFVLLMKKCFYEGEMLFHFLIMNIHAQLKMKLNKLLRVCEELYEFKIVVRSYYIYKNKIHVFLYFKYKIQFKTIFTN